MQCETEDCPEITLHDLPDGSDGRRIVPVEELIAMLNASPELRECVDMVERATGRTTAVKRAVHKQMVTDIQSDMRAAAARKAIEFGMRKHKMMGTTPPPTPHTPFKAVP